MSLDSFLKRYFTWVVVGLVATAAWLQASGIALLVGAALIPSGEKLAELPALADAAPAVDPAVARRARLAQPILRRNPFDSELGPLDAPEVELSLPDDGGDAAAEKVGDPLAAPKCEGVRVSMVTESTDHRWSMADIQGAGDDRAIVRRVGDKVGEATVAFIGYNPMERSPSVWLEEPSRVCQALLFDDEPPPPKKQPVAGGPPAPDAGGGLDPELLKGIKKVSDTEFQIDRGVVDKLMENQAELMRSARIVPEQKDGQVVGVRMFGIKPDRLLGVLGFQNGDRLETINGFSMGSPDKALEAYARLRTADKLTVQLSRRGQPVTIDLHIQ